MEATTTIATTTTSPLTREQVAESLGEDVKRVSLRDVDWSVYAQEGVLVKISVGLCNWVNKMSLEDWGIVCDSEEERKAYERTCAFGSRYILPREVIDPIVAIQGKGRAAVERYSLPTAAGHFMPKKLYAAWRAENDRLREAFMAGAADLEANWETYVAQMDEDFMTVTRRNHRALTAQGIMLELSAEEYGRQALAKSKRRIQSKEAAIAAFRWEWQTTGLPFDPAAEGLFKAAKASGDVLTADLNRTRMEQEGGGLQVLVADLTSQIRGRVYDVVVDCLTALRKGGGKLPAASTTQIRKLVETVETMQFWPDSELDERLEQIRGLVAVPVESRSSDAITGALTALGIEMRSYLLEIDRPPKRSGATLGIPDSRRDLAAARRRKSQRLDLTTVAPVTEVAAPPKRGARKAQAALTAAIAEQPAFEAPVTPSSEDGGPEPVEMTSTQELLEAVRSADALVSIAS